MNVLAVPCMLCACKIKLSSCLDLPLSHSIVVEHVGGSNSIILILSSYARDQHLP